MPRHFLLVFFTLFTCPLFSAEPVSLVDQKDSNVADHTIATIQPWVRKKILAQGYEKLCEAIEANDTVTAQELFTTFPGLKKFSYQSVGSPLHFVRSLAMARLLTEKIGFSVNICDEWGETPAYAIQQSKPDRFSSAEEQKAITLYFKKREVTYQKLKSQLMSNKNFHMKLSIGAMTGVLITQFAVLVTIFLKNIKTFKGV
jgi:hypothetical protein